MGAAESPAFVTCHLVRFICLWMIDDIILPYQTGRQLSQQARHQIATFPSLFSNDMKI